MNFSSIFTGILLVILGILILSFINPINLVSLAIGVSLSALGLYMILNSNKEDKIEQIKKIK